MPEPTQELYLAGDLRIDVGQQRITRGEDELHLPNLSFQLLIALIRGAPNVISNDSLMESVWPGVVVSPETVAKRVNLLRDALGDSANEPRYIAGVRSRGYRLAVAAYPVDALAQNQAALPAADTPGLPPKVRAASGTIDTSPPKAPSGRGHSYWIGLLLALIVAVLIGLIVKRSPSSLEGADGAGKVRAVEIVGARERTVAVLPFDNMSADPADAYLGQGLPEMILNRLSQLAGLSVIARSSSFAPAMKALDSRELGRRLNSAYLVDGSVQRNANQLRVAVQLVDSATGTLLWSAHFDRALNDIFDVEDEIAEQVAAALSTRIDDIQTRPLVAERSSNVAAYIAYLQGRTLLGRFSVAESEAAIPFFEKSVALDPGFAAAYASLYDAHLQAASLRHEDMGKFRVRYRPLIDRALEIDPKSGSAYFARAMWSGEPQDARDLDFRKGSALDPSNGRGLTAYGDFLAGVMLRIEDSRRMLKRALWVDPMSPGARYVDAMSSLDESGARVVQRKMFEVLELDPDFVPALHQSGLYQWLFDGSLARSIQLLEHAIAKDPANPWLRHTAVAVYLDLGDERAARDVAASTPSARAEVMLAMYAGDWRAAGRAAYESAAYDDASWTYNYCQNWLAGEALRDYALNNGELSRAIAFIKEKFYFSDGPSTYLDVCNYHVAVYLSQLLAANGQTDEAQALRHAAASWNDANGAKYLGRTRRVRATILLLDGNQDAALVELAKDFRGGDYVHWWYTLEHDPLWLPLHGDVRYQAIVADVRRHVGAERTALEALRRHGDVPMRGQLPAAH